MNGPKGVTRWRKRPVEVEMILWDGSDEAWQLIANRSGGLPERRPDGSINIWVEASQAEMNLDQGAWAIIEQDGSGVYPCRAADHVTTYEPVTAPADGIVHYTCTRIQLIDALAALPLGGYLTLEARSRFADCILAQLPEASPSSAGAELITAERRRQVAEEGWTAGHDAEHTRGELARAAACYAIPAELRRGSPRLADGRGDDRGDRYKYAPDGWPWHPDWWKPAPSDDRIRDLVRAGALLAAEIDRLTASDRPLP